MDNDELRVADLIRSAFRDVRLGDGVGLRQGQGLDDYADPQALAKLRDNDEKNNWSAISFEDLNLYHASLSFFDAEGMRFHLPAYLIASLENVGPDVIFHLTCAADDSRFGLLDSVQRKAVREFLLLRLLKLPEPNRGFESPIIEEALDKYWTTK